MKNILITLLVSVIAVVSYWQLTQPEETKQQAAIQQTDVSDEQELEVVLPQVDWNARLGLAWKQWDAEVELFVQVDRGALLIETQRYNKLEESLPLRSLVGEQLADFALLESSVGKLEISVMALRNFRQEIQLLNASQEKAIAAKGQWQQHATDHHLGLSEVNATRQKLLTKSIDAFLDNEDFIKARFQYEQCEVYFNDIKESSLSALSAKAEAGLQQNVWKNILPSLADHKGIVDEAVNAQKAWSQAQNELLHGDFQTAQKNYELASLYWVQAADAAALILAMPKMIDIPGGVFQMGDLLSKGQRDEKPVHKVNVLPFSMSETSITFAQYDAFSRLTRTPVAKDDNWGRGKHPVINVSWSDAQAYTRWLSEVTGKTYRLPTESEWEFAARSGNQFEYGISDIINNKAHCEGCDGWNQQASLPVASFEPNAYGLYDMQGNVWEWVQDCYESDYALVPVNGNAHEKDTCDNRVARGGSWQDLPSALRVSNRTPLNVKHRNNKVGFRVVLAKPVQLSGTKLAD